MKDFRFAWHWLQKYTRLLQLMPVWIVKKIFSYLDYKQLQVAKQVNDYWAYIIQEILKELKSRQSLDMFLYKYKEKINQQNLRQALEKLKKEGNTNPIRQKPEYEEAGIISKKLLTKQTRTIAETSLLSEATKQRDQHLQSFSGELVTFPRIIRNDVNLYRHSPCFLKDANVRLGIEEDIEYQRSVLTYSLTTFTSSLKINLNEDQLSDW